MGFGKQIIPGVNVPDVMGADGKPLTPASPDAQLVGKLMVDLVTKAAALTPESKVPQILLVKQAAVELKKVIGGIL